MNSAIAKFLKATAIQKLNMLRFGFELETQSTGDDDELDEDAYAEAVDEAVADMMNELPDWVPERLVERLREHCQETVEVDTSPFYRGSESVADALVCNVNDSIKETMSAGDVLEFGKDGSVSGWEFRTIGGLPMRVARNVLENIFDLETHEIDERCSFHVHVSLPGVKHQYGQRFQLAMCEYVVEQMHRLPSSVKYRFSKIEKLEWFRGFVGSREKYSFVHFHGQGTWEFRCFGNVSRYKDGVQCMRIAAEALAYAYEVCFTGKRMLLDAYDGDASSLLTQCCVYQRSVSKQLWLIRKETRRNDIGNVA